MVVANFGMGYRPNSEVVKTDDQLKKDYLARRSSLRQRLQGPEELRLSALSDYGAARVAEGRQMGYSLGDDYAQLAARVAGREGYGSQHILNPSNFSVPLGPEAIAAGERLRGIEGKILGINTAIGSADHDYADLMARRQDAAQTQQAAYNSNQIGAAGGVLPGISHQGTLDPTQAASWNTPWMQPGFGNPGSLGGLGGYNPQNGQNGQQQNGWGGVFGNKNPWSMA